MIFVYSTKALSPKAVEKLVGVKTLLHTKNSIKARNQPRHKDGRFAKPLPKPATVKNNPLVEFFYPMSDNPFMDKSRTVRLISANSTHFTGLEQQDNWKWQYKKFLRSRAPRTRRGAA